MDRAVYDRMAEIDGAHWWFVARRKIIAALIERLVKPLKPARILEVGAGTGSNILLLQRYGAVDAIEPDDDARALEGRKHAFTRLRAYALPSPDRDAEFRRRLDVLRPPGLGRDVARRSEHLPAHPARRNAQLFELRHTELVHT